jgi:hypothetical protein
MLQFLLKALSFSKSLVPNLGALSLMVGSYLLQMNLRSDHEGIGSGHGSTSVGAGHDPEARGENGRDNANGESHGPHSWVLLCHHHHQ